MLNVQSSIDVDACIEQSLSTSCQRLRGGCRDIGMSQFVDNQELVSRCHQGAIEIKFGGGLPLPLMACAAEQEGPLGALAYPCDHAT